MSAAAKTSDRTSAHERVYRSLRQSIMLGEMAPAESLTLRGIATKFEVSMTPARESVRRLVAEGALTLSSSGRVTTPDLNAERIEELAAIRAMLEPELAARALRRVHPALIDRLRAINSTVDQMIAKQEPIGYIRSNLEFHRTIYLRAQAPAMLALVETIWLQLGPTMRKLYTAMRRTEQVGNHRAILAALKSADEEALRRAVAVDVAQGLQMLTP